MILLDFIFYYLALYFTKNSSSLTWSSPERRAAYALGLITTSWIIALIFFTLIYILHDRQFNGGILYLLIPVAMILIWFYGRLYVDKERYYIIKASGRKIFDLNDNIGIIIAFLILISSFFLPFAILISDMK